MKLVPLKSAQVKLKEDMILERAQELVQGGWCQGGFAKTELGEEAWPDSKNATQFCATGAVIRAMLELKIGNPDDPFNSAYYINVVQRLLKAIGLFDINDPDIRSEDSIIMVWNDHDMKSMEDVALAFKRARHDTD